MNFSCGSVAKEFVFKALDAGDAGSIPGSEDPQEEGMAIHASILAWRIPWTEEQLEQLSTHDLRVDTVADFIFFWGGVPSKITADGDLQP